MYAVIQTGGKQYMVNEGDILKVEKLDIEEGNTYEITDVLAISSEGSISTGDDNVNAKVTAKVLRHGKGKKVIVFKYKPKKDYRRKQGHRQPYTEIQIESISK